MQSTWLVLLIMVLLLTGGGLLLWLIRQRRQAPLAQAGFVDTRPVFADTDPMSAARGAPHVSNAGTSDDDDLPSYMDMPENSRFESRFGNSGASLFQDSQVQADFTSSTMPQALALTEPSTSAQPLAKDRIQRALKALGDGPVDQAWQTLQGYFPDRGHVEAAMSTLARIAEAYEAEGRYECARDVYEHMADIDPAWPEIKGRLTRARDMAQASTVHTWGTVPAQPIASVARTAAAPTQLGRFVVEGLLGKGAMGAVYLARDGASGRRVALKTMALAQEFRGAELADARARFLREADMAGRLQHPDIVSILAAGEQDGVAYIAMELVDGTDLGQHAQPGHLLPLDQLIPVMARVADALGYAHSKGVTHRDIKPANIMVNLEQGVVKVMDFGVARVADTTRTRTGVVLGTPTYMSPEQLSGQNVDSRSDLYSLGVTLFQLLTGQLPYRNDSMAALMRAIGREPAPDVCSIRSDLPPQLGRVVALALEKQPASRHASGEAMAQALRAVSVATPPLDLELG